MSLKLKIRHVTMMIFVLCIPRIVLAQKEVAINRKGSLVEIRNTVTSTSSTAPSTPLKNDIWFDTASKETKVFNGNTWLTINADALNKKEDSANKSTNTALSDNTNTKFPTEKAVKTYVDAKFLKAVDHDWYKAYTTFDLPNAINNHIWTSGYVGIGDNNEPQSELDVIGTGLFRKGNGAESYTNNQLLFSFNGTTNHKHALKTRHHASNSSRNAIDFYLWKAGDAATAVGSKHVMSMTGEGKVGIGSATPETELDVKGTGLFRQGYYFNRTPTNQLLFSWNGTTNYKHALKTRHHSSNGNLNALDFYLWNPVGDGVTAVGSKQVMSMTGTGRVGIGTTAPTAELDVVGTGVFREGNYKNAFTKNQLLFSFNGTAQHRHAIKTRHQNNSFNGNAIDFFLWKQGDNADAIGNKHVMSMTGAGRVGINTTAPESELDVKGTGLFRKGNGADAYTRNQLLFSYNGATNYKHALKTRHHGANSSESAIDFYLWKPGDDGVADIGSKQVMSMTSAGRVGIGTALPESELDVKGTGLFRAGNNTGTTNNQLLFSYNYGHGYQHAIKTRHSNSVPNNNAIDFYLWKPGNGTLNVASKQVMSMTGAGRVGIGTKAPAHALHVVGDTKTTGSFITSTSTYPDYVFDHYVKEEKSINSSYTFKSIEEIDAFIKKNKHLPGVTGIKELAVEKDGRYSVNLTQTALQTLEKVEELYLYTIEQHHTIEQQAAELNSLKQSHKQLQNRLAKIEELLKNR